MKMTVKKIIEINKLYDNGSTMAEIAPMFNICVATVGQYVSKPREHGCGKSGPTKVTKEMIKKMNELYGNFKSLKQVGEEMGLSTYTIWKYVEK